MRNSVLILVIVFIAVLCIGFGSVLAKDNSDRRGNDLLELSDDIAERDDAEIVIEVMESASVNTRKLYLNDIADIEAPGFLKQRIGRIDVGFAPGLGKVKVYKGERLKARIESESLISGDLSVLVPDRVYIKRASQEIPRQQFKNIFMDYIKERVNKKEFHVRDFDVRNSGIYQKGDVSLFLLSGRSRDIKGRLTLYVNVRIDGEKCDRVSVSGWVDVFDDVVCASKTLKRGSVISPSDLYVEKMNISNMRGQYVSCLEDAMGMALKTSVKHGRSLRFDMLEDPPIVHRGEMVKLIVSTGNLSIIASGIAREDGKLNEQICVKNIRSGRIVHCVVTGQSKVKVMY
ncbi:MAG: flagellar basal body P-ring formation chaperone FlgA [Thermodesulfobacteriota bacterium]|nr:flagellar basal body P-ring formation chaperone FlgA [Thermodesulfobacteriota bacterium]